MPTTSGTDLRPEQIWAGNGSNEVLQHVLQAFGGPGRHGAGLHPDLLDAPDHRTGAGTAWVDGLRGRGGGDDPFDADRGRTPSSRCGEHDPDVVFLCSPEQPDRHGARPSTSSRPSTTRPPRHRRVDEAYAEFARPGTPSALTLLPGRERLVVTRTMSKAFALAGARLGYLAADPAVCDAFRLVRLPYHLSSLTQAAARAALWHADVLLSHRRGDQGAAGPDRRRAAPRWACGAVPSDANFVLFGGLADERATWKALLEHGVLIRDVGIAAPSAGHRGHARGDDRRSSTPSKPVAIAGPASR